MTAEVWTAIILAALGGGGLATIVVKLLSRGTDQAVVERERALVRTADIDNLRSIIAELRQSEALKTARIDNLEARLDKLEERERHMLTRAAVHEAWDQMAFAALLTMDPRHPPPPPLALPDGYHRRPGERSSRDSGTPPEDAAD